MTGPLIPGGYILLSRRLIQSEIWDKPPLYLKIWIYLLSRAQHQDYKNLKRGQLRTSIPKIIEAMSYKIGYRTERPTKDQVWGVIEWLRNPPCAQFCEHLAKGSTTTTMNAPMITTTKATHGLLINIVNYGLYQTSENYEANNEPDNEPNNEKVTNTTTTRQYKQECIKNDKKENKDHCRNIYSDDSLEMKMCQYMVKRILESYPGARIPSNLNKWCLSLNRLMRIDGRTVDDIREVMRWVYQDEFWCTNIRSPEKLREKWDTVYLQMQRKQKYDDSTQEPAAPYHRKIGGAS